MARVGPRVIPCEEHADIDIDIKSLLDDEGRLELNPELESKDYFRVRLSSGRLWLRSAGFVGHIPLTKNTAVHVTPRVPVENLERVLEISGAPRLVLATARGYATNSSWNDSVLEIYARALIAHVGQILERGLMREYRRREDESSFPRGRIELTATVQRFAARGIHHKAEVAWFERVTDTAANRCLKYAIWALAIRFRELGRTFGDDRPIFNALNALYGRFDGVELDASRRFLKDPLVAGRTMLPTSRAYYADALGIATAIAERKGITIDSPGGTLSLPSTVIDMNAVFEGFVRNSLQTAFRRRGSDWTVVDGNKQGKPLFDHGSKRRATPDVLLEVPGQAPIILEVKNVPTRGQSERDAVNQALAYAVSFRSDHAILVHPRSSANQPAGLQHQGHIAGIDLHQYRVDLAAADLDAEGDRLADRVYELVMSRSGEPPSGRPVDQPANPPGAAVP